MSDALVTIGVPVYRGGAFLEEALQSIQAQTYRNLQVLVALDGSDPECERIISKFLSDSRFRLQVQPERLGWFGNINWLMTQASGHFWIYHGQDDRTSNNYVEALVEHASDHAEAALVHGDMESFGTMEGRWDEGSVHGSSAFMRQMTLMCSHYPGVAFHGLTRSSALARAAGIPANDFDNIATDIAWMAAVALSGELHRTAGAIYWKRFHGHNVSGRAATWSRRRRLQAWSGHCVNMLDQALRADTTVHEARLLWLAALSRLCDPSLTTFLFDATTLTPGERRLLVASFLKLARASTLNDVPTLLDLSWQEIEDLTRVAYWAPRRKKVEIVDFGPRPVQPGQPFEVQPDGSSAIWARTSRRCEPGARLQLGGVPLETTVSGALLTARVPPALTDKPGTRDLLVLRPDGGRRSRTVSFTVAGSSR